MSSLSIPETPVKTHSQLNKTNPADPSCPKPFKRTHSESKTQAHCPPCQSLPLNTFTPSVSSHQPRSSFHRELNALKAEFNCAIAQLRKEIDDISHNKATSEPDTPPSTHIKQLWMKLSELTSEMNTLRSQANSNAMNCKNVDSKVNSSIMLYEKQEAKLNELANAYDGKCDMNEWMTKVNVVNTQYACLLLKLSEVNKRENALIQSVNKINVNEKTIDNNMKRIANKVKENGNDIKELKAMITMNNSNAVQSGNSKNESSVGVNEVNYLKANIDNKFTAVKDVLLNEIGNLKEANAEIKSTLSTLEMKYTAQINALTNEVAALKNENANLKQLLLSKDSNNNTSNNTLLSVNNDTFNQFKLKQEHVNDEHSAKIKAVENKTNEIETKIEAMNEFNLSNFLKNDQNLHEINQILPIVPQNEDNLKIMYENVHNIEENNENLKKDITQYKCEISKWQDQLADHIDGQFKMFKNVYDKKFEHIADYMKDKCRDDDDNKEFPSQSEVNKQSSLI